MKFFKYVLLLSFLIILIPYVISQIKNDDNSESTTQTNLPNVYSQNDDLNETFFLETTNVDNPYSTPSENIQNGISTEKQNVHRGEDNDYKNEEINYKIVNDIETKKKDQQKRSPEDYNEDTKEDEEDNAGATHTTSDTSGSKVDHIIENKENDVIDYKDEPVVPSHLSESADSFIYGSIEYIVVSTKLKFYQVRTICKENYGADLAVVSNKKIADFLAEALLETNLELDSLWIGGENISVDSEYNWYWTSNTLELIDAKFFESIVAVNTNVSNGNRMCLGFGRSSQLQPQFRPLGCLVHRSFICERKKPGGLGEKNSTHFGWIKLDKKFYKIYYDTLSWEEALLQCPKHNLKATLAVIPNYRISQLLGRYLLIGRPSIENAWIGAHYDNALNAYKFDGKQQLDHTTNSTNNYPPWKSNKVGKTKGCVLLDRHVSDETVFLEARCERLRSYICSIDPDDNSSKFSDIVIEDFGYRVHLQPRCWNEAYEFCNTYDSYGGKLMEITTTQQLSHALYIMGDISNDIQHLWLGGRYDGTKWVWVNSKTVIDTNLLNFVKNDSYTQSVEEKNTCLNMDRENHLTGLHYGIDCSWSQQFVCLFSASEFQRLKDEEEKGTL